MYLENLRRESFFLVVEQLLLKLLLEKLEQLERAARGHLRSLMARQRNSISQSEADQLANEAKHESRSGTR